MDTHSLCMCKNAPTYCMPVLKELHVHLIVSLSTDQQCATITYQASIDQPFTP